MNYSQIIKIKYPGIEPHRHFQVAYTEQSNGSLTCEIVHWSSYNNEPKPTIEQLEAYTKTDEYVQRLDAIKKLEYRQDRAKAYIAELSPEAKFETSVGDLFDAIIKAIYGNTTELDQLTRKINDIKQRYPEPE